MTDEIVSSDPNWGKTDSEATSSVTWDQAREHVAKKLGIGAQIASAGPGGIPAGVRIPPEATAAVAGTAAVGALSLPGVAAAVLPRAYSAYQGGKQGYRMGGVPGALAGGAMGIINPVSTGAVSGAIEGAEHGGVTGAVVGGVGGALMGGGKIGKVAKLLKTAEGVKEATTAGKAVEAITKAAPAIKAASKAVEAAPTAAKMAKFTPITDAGELIDKIKYLKEIEKLSGAQIAMALKHGHGIPMKEATQAVKMVLGGM